MDLEEFVGVYNLDLGSNQKAILKRIITKLKEKEAEQKKIEKIIVSADTPIFFDIDTLVDELNSEKDSHSTAAKKHHMRA